MSKSIYEELSSKPVDVIALTNVCRKFVEDNRISCPETIYQCDWVIQNAYKFIQQMCDIVGYQQVEGDE